MPRDRGRDKSKYGPSGLLFRACAQIVFHVIEFRN
jgi:hypothetical protein